MLATSPNQVSQYGPIPLLVPYIISFVCSTNMSKHCKNKQYFTCLRWAIPQYNRMVHQIEWSDKME